ncbi:disco-interacting protein 2 homolog C-like [Daphnia carinata]|uniref:disco-interacting protein 2 homolog C-like n=1 Tax=Daphnia carinata TaxID=120202 RepID=UPI00257FB06D|nr:disco-interacting protein 2 homolog C-like [Daphnia carinata]
MSHQRRLFLSICLQGASSSDPSTVYANLRALRNGRVTVVERGAPHSLCLTEAGKLLPGVKVIIDNPATKGQCCDTHLGKNMGPRSSQRLRLFRSLRRLLINIH